MDVGVDAAGGEDGLLTGNGFRAGTDDDVNARLHIGIAGLADAADAAVLDADIGLDDAPVVEDQALVMTTSTASLPPAWLWPMPSRITLPPPNLTSSP